MSALVIGYGSALRGDDAVGHHVAEAVHLRALPGVEARSLHQLGPELAVDLGGVDLVVFVDADVQAERIVVRRVHPAEGSGGTTHHMRPEVLLAMTASLALPVPTAVVVGVPVTDLGLSETLSADAAIAVDRAVEVVVRLIEARHRWFGMPSRAAADWGADRRRPPAGVGPDGPG